MPLHPQREPERVLDGILAVLATGHDLRVGQIVAIAAAEANRGNVDPFSIEDGDLAAALERVAARYRAAPPPGAR